MILSLVNILIFKLDTENDKIYIKISIKNILKLVLSYRALKFLKNFSNLRSNFRSFSLKRAFKRVSRRDNWDVCP